MKIASFTLNSTSIDSLYTSINQSIGGERQENRIQGETTYGKVNLESFNHIPHFNISINKINLHTPIELDNILKEDRNSIFMLLLQEGNHLTLHHEGQDSYILKKGELIIYSKIEKVKLFFNNNDDLTIIGIRIDREQLSQLFQNDEFAYKDLIKELRNAPKVEKLSPKEINTVEEIIQLQSSTAFGKNSIIIGKGLELSGEILSKTYQKIKQHPGKIISDHDLSIYQEIKDYILNDFSNIPTIAFLSKKFGIGETKLKQGFKRLFGEPIFKYITIHRMLEAHRLIEMTGQPISNISREIGYSHLSKFSTVFKKYYGYTPTQLRKNTLINSY